ncbi:Putative HEX1 [[Torrubiella] hemipterigena]|uniref:Putative HEX1 n=1 Tax=[Torrubiella] hemipterigena TaxID=1531966 RepID=A0A0A1TPK8_9HYPO|nr:Putative HEX1 [[Torrubiella] hemipterigena]
MQDDAMLSNAGLHVITPRQVVNLDFEARVPVPFSIFPSTYKNGESQTQTETHQQVDINLPPQQQHAGREGQHNTYSSEEQIRITREEDSRRRPGFQHTETTYVEQDCYPGRNDFRDTRVEVDARQYPYDNAIDIAEREYRQRFQSANQQDYAEPRYNQPQDSVCVEQFTTEDHRAPYTSTQHNIRVSETVEQPSKKMGYYDDDGHYHSFRQGLHNLADRIVHPHREHIDVEIRESHGPAPAPRRESNGERRLPNTVSIPCHHIRIGDFVMLQGRACQVIRISTSAATGQYRYLGVDLFTRQLHEESSFVSNPAPSVVVQTMLGPVFKQYRVLDMQDGHVVAMTESGDVKQRLPVVDQSNLWARLRNAFESGRGSVRALVLSDNGRELAVDMKVIHGSRL